MNVALTPLNFTDAVPLSLVPVMVTMVPTAPLLGEKLAMAGGVGLAAGINWPMRTRSSNDFHVPVSPVSVSRTVSVQSPAGFSPQKALPVNHQSTPFSARLSSAAFSFSTLANMRLRVPPGEVKYASN